MLVNKIIGNVNVASVKWRVEKDSYGVSFLINDSIKQKIRLNNNVTPKLEKTLGDEDGNCVIYDIDDNIVFSNSNRNMHLAILKHHQKSKADASKTHHDMDIAYITLSTSDYKLISYMPTGMSRGIVQTYRMKDCYQGCALLFDSSTMNDENLDSHGLIYLTVYEYETKRFLNIFVYVEDGLCQYSVSNHLDDKKELSKIKSKFKKIENRMVHFKLSNPGGKIPTSTIIVNGASQQLVDDVKVIADKIKDANVLVLPAGNNSFKTPIEEEKESIDRMFAEHIVDKRIRAVTCVGIKLTAEICKKYKIMYVFDVDTETGFVKCVKSN